jgi:hypothetical protein
MVDILLFQCSLWKIIELAIEQIEKQNWVQSAGIHASIP